MFLLGALLAANLGLASTGCGSDSDGGIPGTTTGGASAGGTSAGGASGTSAGGGGGTSTGGASVGGTSSGGASGGSAGGSRGGSGGGAGAPGGGGAGGAAPCATRITYGSTWIKPPNHPANHDDVAGEVTWDGSCALDGSGNAYATLSNGWKPFFQGRTCILALDSTSSCPNTPATCETRVHYGPSWLPAPNHPSFHDDVTGVLTWDGTCSSAGGESMATLSNGWTPHFSGNACDLSFRYRSCHGLFENPVVPVDCPDPGVTKVGSTYFMTCTPGPGFPIRSSKDLVNWKDEGAIFDSASKPSWATSLFWAPEIHAVGGTFVAYFSAKSGASGTFAIGAATAPTPTGPFQDIGHPLVTEPAPGAIDAHYFRASSGKEYLLWKVDGNAVGQKTPIKIQELTPNGTGLVGAPKTLLDNTLAWEGAVVEGPWMVEHAGSFYLFYSGNGYASPSYGVGVAKSSSPLGPFTKKGAAILSSKGDWAGPGHGSVLVGPSGDWVFVYHAWHAGQVGQAPGRVVLVDRVEWSGGWPSLLGAPSTRSQPMP